MKPPIIIVCTTYFPPGPDGLLRREIAEQTVASWKQHLRYLGDLSIHVADDGSDGDAFVPPRWWYSNSRQERHGVGASLNAGLRKAFEQSPLVVHAVDDWVLLYDFDLTPWADWLMEDETVGMIRLGPPHPWLTGTVEHNEGRWAMRLDRHHFAFATRPFLLHKRMIDRYGWFDEDVSAYECERLYNERFCSSSGPDVLLALPSAWDHMGGVELGDIDPVE